MTDVALRTEEQESGFYLLSLHDSVGTTSSKFQLQVQHRIPRC